MSRLCSYCGKGLLFGQNKSHANNKTKRTFFPNLREVRAVLPTGEVKRVKVCTSCLKSGKVQKAA